MDKNFLNEKAFIFKNRIEYDSALAYHEKLQEVLEISGDDREVILNQINICDIYILQREFVRARTDLDELTLVILSSYPGDIDLKADFFQVKGSYHSSTGNPDSAKYFLNLSIKIRISKHSLTDTIFHYVFNKLGNLHLSQSDFDSAYIYHQFALDLALKKQNPINYLAASSYQNLGIAAHMKGDYKTAETCYLKSLQLKEILFDFNDPALAKIYWNLGKFYSDRSKYNLAISYYDKSEQLLISRYDRNDLQFAHVYWNKGNIYTHYGDFKKAINYLTKAYSTLEHNLGPDDQEVSKVLLDLGFAYYKIDDHKSAIEYYNRAANNKNHASIIKIYRNLAISYQELDKKDSVEKYYHLAIDFANKFYSGNNFDLALCYQYYGEFLAKLEDYDKSMDLYEQASKILISLFGQKNKDLSKIYRLQSEIYITTKEYDSAIYKVQEALLALLPGFSEKDPKNNPALNNNILDIYLQDALWLKAIAYHRKYLFSNNLEDLIASFEIINLTLTLTEEIRKTYNDEESQLILNKNARKVIDLGVLVTLRLYRETGEMRFLADAFRLSEKGQAIILLSALRGLEAQSNTNLPKSTRDFENDLSTGMANYNNLIYQEREKAFPDEDKLKLWSDQIFSLGLSHDSILATHKELHPDYYKLKYDYSTISADSALNSLTDDQAMLQYYITDTLVICFLLTDGKLDVQILGDKNYLISKLDSLRHYFTRSDYFNAGQKEFEAITSISAELYDFLVRPFEEKINGKRLIIIPDGELGYLSFDLLLSNLPENLNSYNDLPWLIKSNPISYSSSATIYFEQKRTALKTVSGDLLAFAPSYDFLSIMRKGEPVDSAMMNLSPMTGTKEEINAISELFRTKKLFDEKATETFFKKHAGNYKILHLAMHTIIDDKNPLYSKLVFTPTENDTTNDGYLNTYELFGLHLPGQLAVLSACNTGSGKLERGEGIISLARGFFYAGIPNVVMTLWEIEDHSSADLVALFYENLKRGLPSDIALQQAKITYLEKAGKMQSHPYFWAGYVNIGKTEPIIMNSARRPSALITIGIATVLICILIYFFINRRVYFNKKGY